MVNNAAMNMGVYNKYFLETVLSILLDVYPEVKFLNHMAILFLIFWETAIPFLIMAAPFYFLINSAPGFYWRKTEPANS